METYNYPHLLIFLIIFALGGLCYIIYMVIKNEKEKKRYQETMEVGDMVYVASVREGIYGKIHELDQDTVTITLKVSKSRVYPLDENKK